MMGPTKEELDELRILTFTTLYPNAAKPQHGIFVENRLRQLLTLERVSAHVLAPVPYFPFRSEAFGAYAVFARAPTSEVRFGIPVDHPRFLTIPKLGMIAAPFLLYATARSALRRMLQAGTRFDLIDAHYLYPDGVAAAMLGQAFDMPVTVTARGSDVNTIPAHALPRHMIRRAAKQIDGLIAVSSALKAKLVELGIEPGRVTVLRNGVDENVFRPAVPFGASGGVLSPTLAVSVGNLVPLKGHDLAISALPQIPELGLWIVGSGPEQSRLETLARSLGVVNRVRFLGSIPHERMPEVYSAADILILASEREGWPNVLLEAMACGARVVATNVSDVPAIINDPAAGTWIQERTLPALVEGIRRVLEHPTSRSATRAHALRFTWDATTRGQVELFRAIVDRWRGNRRMAGSFR
jgi:teichuronic acid biosynthesis glycosyltransferase TuaC